LGPNQALWSTDGRFTTVMQSDGNLVEYGPGGAVAWSSNTGAASSTVIMQRDGNLVVYSPGGQAQWSSSTAPTSGDRLVQQADGNLVIYSGTGRALWSSASGLISSTGGNPSPSGQSIVDEAVKWIG